MQNTTLTPQKARAVLTKSVGKDHRLPGPGWRSCLCCGTMKHSIEPARGKVLENTGAAYVIR